MLCDHGGKSASCYLGTLLTVLYRVNDSRSESGRMFRNYLVYYLSLGFLKAGCRMRILEKLVYCRSVLIRRRRRELG